MIDILKSNNKIITGHCIDTTYEVLGANTQTELNELNEKAIALSK